MANKMWVAGMESANPKGAPRKSVRTAAGMLDSFIKRNVSPQQLKKLFDKLTAREQADFLLKSFPYVMAPKSNEALTAHDIDLAYSKLMEAINKQSNAKAS